MCRKNDDALVFVCSLIEAIGRQVKRRRGEVVSVLGKKELRRLYDYADVLHCEPIEKAANDCIMQNNIKGGAFDNVADCIYTVPSIFDIGKTYARLIEDTSCGSSDIIDSLMQIYISWIDQPISDYNIVVYYQPREYLAACYLAQKIL